MIPTEFLLFLSIAAFLFCLFVARKLFLAHEKIVGFMMVTLAAAPLSRSSFYAGLLFGELNDNLALAVPFSRVVAAISLLSIMAAAFIALIASRNGE